MLRSENGGRSWSTLAVPGSKVWAVAPVASDPARVYAGSDVGIFQSVDSGPPGKPLRARPAQVLHRKVAGGRRDGPAPPLRRPFRQQRFRLLGQ